MNKLKLLQLIVVSGVICSASGGTMAADAATTSIPSNTLEARLDHVRTVMKIKASQSFSAELSQYWPNWPNWRDWSNWRDWGNWRNWGNY